ncbi:MAG: type II toxin-antitoxin system RelE/ParE family toxin [Bdellovibrionota bacterium]
MLIDRMSAPTELVARGNVFAIEAFISDQGGPLALKFLESLSEKEQVPMAALFQRMADTGKIWNEQKFKHLEGSDSIFEFKTNENRVLCFFFVGKRVILTHGFKKKQPKTPKDEIERAENLKKEFERKARHEKRS